MTRLELRARVIACTDPKWWNYVEQAKASLEQTMNPKRHWYSWFWADRNGR